MNNTSYLLWLDKSEDSLDDRVGKAADYFAEKYGLEPDLCLVPEEEGDFIDLDWIKVEKRKNVPPHSLMIGKEGESLGIATREVYT